MLNFKVQDFKAIIKLASPIIGVRMLYVLTNFIGMLFITQLGLLETAAGAIVTVLSTTIIVIAMSPFLSIGIIASRYFGQQNFKKIGELLNQSWLVALMISALVFIFMRMVPFLLTKLHQPPEIIPYVKSYMDALSWGVLPLLLIASCHQFCFSIKQARLVCIWSVLTLIFTLPLGYMLINGIAGAPKLGIAGWAWASTCVNWLMAINIIIYLMKNELFFPFQIKLPKINSSLQEFKNIIYLGMPITLQFAGELLAYALLNMMVGWLGVVSLSAQLIILQCSSLALMIPMGTSQACAILIGQTIGKSQTSRLSISRLGQAGMAAVIIIMSLIGGFYMLYPNTLIKLYIHQSNPEASQTIYLAKTLLILAAFSQIADSIRNVFIGALRGLKDVWAPMIVNSFLLALGLPIAYVLSFKLNLGLLGLNAGLFIVFLIGAIVMFIRFKVKVDKIILI